MTCAIREGRYLGRSLAVRALSPGAVSGRPGASLWALAPFPELGCCGQRPGWGSAVSWEQGQSWSSEGRAAAQTCDGHPAVELPACSSLGPASRAEAGPGLAVTCGPGSERHLPVWLSVSSV